VRLLSRRPSILFKVAHFATPGYGGDVAEDGLVIAGSDWTSRLEVLLATLSVTERESLFALRLREQHPLPLHARVLLDRHLTDWFPEFLSAGRMVPHFQPIVDLREARVVGREALMRGTLGDTELSGGADALRCIEIVRPDVAKLDRAITSGIEESRAKRRLVAAIVEVAKDQNCRVVAEGIERASEFEVMRDLGVDYGQGWYFGRPQKDPGPVDAALFSPGTQLV
jgi:predicted signal transduction protein with EAL and GGDEF domain